MSFLKITDPNKRDCIDNEFLKKRQNIRQNFLSEHVGDLNTQYELSKLFKPVMDMQKELKEGLVSEIKPIREGMINSPNATTFPQFPFITAYDDDGEEKAKEIIGDIAEQYLRKFASESGADKTFRFRDKDGKFCIGNKETKIKKNNTIVDGKEDVGTPGLWELIMGTTLDDKIFTNEMMIIILK